MTSADFCVFSTASFPCTMLTPVIGPSVQISLSTTRFFLPVCSPHLPAAIPCSYWVSTCKAASPSQLASYAISVRRVGDLPAPSFRFCLAADTLGVQLCPSHYRAGLGLSPFRNVRRQAHLRSAQSERPPDVLGPTTCSCRARPKYPSLHSCTPKASLGKHGSGNATFGVVIIQSYV